MAATQRPIRQFGVNALRNLPEFQDQDRAQMFAQEVEPVAQPSTASGIGQVDVLGSTAPIGASSSAGAGRGSLRQMASNNPAVAQALGIRGATAGFFNEQR